MRHFITTRYLLMTAILVTVSCKSNPNIDMDLTYAADTRLALSIKIDKVSLEKADIIAEKSEWKSLSAQKIDYAGDIVSWVLSAYPMNSQEEAKAVDEFAEKFDANNSAKPCPKAINVIFSKLVEAIPDHMKPKDFKFSLKMINLLQPNAFTIGAGRVYITKGLVDLFCRDHPDAIAFVLAHELGHICRRHTMSGYKLKKIVKQLGPELEHKFGSLLRVALNVSSLLVPFLYSRENELAADIFGFHLCRNAGFNTEKALVFHRWLTLYECEREKRKTDNVGIYLLTSHPVPALRLKWLLAERKGQPSCKSFGLFSFNRKTKKTTGIPDNEEINNPIIFIHGIESGSSTFSSSISMFEKDRRFMGRTFVLFRYPNDDSISKNSIFLKNELGRIRMTGQVDFVCHSAGGLVFRNYSERLSGSFRKAILIGTPNHGSNVASLRIFTELMEHGPTSVLPDRISKILKPYADGRGQVTYDLQPGSLFLCQLGTKPVDPKRYLVINGKMMNPLVAMVLKESFSTAKDLFRDTLIKNTTSDFIKTVADHMLKKIVIPDEILDGDGAVSVKRSMIKGVKSHTFKLNHIQLHADEKAFRPIAEFLSK